MAKRELLLVPRPQEVKMGAGWLKLGDELAIGLPTGAGRMEQTAASQLADDLAALEVEGLVSRRSTLAKDAAGGVQLRLGKVSGGEEAYRLNVTTKGVEVVASGPRGLYYGVQTLRQIIRQHGRRLPTVQIADWPELKFRGVYHDISRGRVPTVETLMELIELLASLKVNALSLYVEYPFRYQRHPAMWEDTRPLTAEEMLELGEFAKDHGVDFVPSQASFGHLERLLSKPAYRKLANTPPSDDLKGTRTFRRQGTSLDPTNPASIRLIEDLYDEFLPQFDSEWFNACCDEVWDLGTGRSESRAKRIGKGRLFAEFICKIERAAARHGKKLMIWADILKHHPDSIAAIPKDVVFLNWWYLKAAESKQWMEDHSKAIRKSGHPMIVCPGVNNWGAFMPRVATMRDNIANFTDAGIRYGAIGQLNTEWGDGGHFNLLGTALPGFAWGAEHAWAHSRADEKTIGQRWSLQVLGDHKGDAERLIRLADFDGPWYHGIVTGFGDERLLKPEEVGTTPAKLLARVEQFTGQLEKASELGLSLAERLGELESVAAMELALLSRATLYKSYAVRGQLHKGLGDGKAARRLFAEAARGTEAILPMYESMWLVRNHRSELDWSVGRFRDAIRRWKRAAKSS